jgi:hypothetical protein
VSYRIRLLCDQIIDGVGRKTGETVTVSDATWSSNVGSSRGEIVEHTDDPEPEPEATVRIRILHAIVVLGAVRWAGTELDVPESQVGGLLARQSCRGPYVELAEV